MLKEYNFQKKSKVLRYSSFNPSFITFDSNVPRKFFVILSRHVSQQIFEYNHRGVIYENNRNYYRPQITIYFLILLSIIYRLLLCSCLVVSNFLWPHGLQHTRLPCPSLSCWVCSNSCPSNWWCHPTISSSFSSYLQSCPASGSFPMSLLFASGGQSIGASASVLPVNIQGWLSLELTVWISSQSKEE